MTRFIPVRAVVIDDDERTCRRLHEWLEEARFTAATFTRAREGLRYIGQGGCQLALVDLRMPDVDGPELIADISRASPDTRVLAMAAFPETPEVIAAVRAGARDLLEKPVQQPSLLSALERHLAALGILGRTQEEFNRRLGQRLRSLRTASGQSLSDVAKLSGISPAQLSQIELGRSAASTWTLVRLSGTLRVPLAMVFTDV
jgi:DNA-binding NtrC family response regulator